MTDLPGRLHQLILDRKLFRKGQAILVGVSGGVDSMVLLHALHELAGGQSWKLIVAHLNHRLRGNASRADQRLVKETARKLKLPFVSDHANIRALARKEKISIEMAARKLRHDFLAKLALKLAAPTVALAHHADDQVELFFLRLFRGSGNLGGMKWRSASPSDKRVQLARPLLNFTKKDLLDFAKTRGIPFRQDASNQSLAFQRNRIRHELLPLLQKKYHEALPKSVLRVMDIAGEESAFVEQCAKHWLHGLCGGRPGAIGSDAFGFLAKLPFDQLSVAVQRRAIYTQLTQLGIAADFELVEVLRTSPQTTVNIPAARKARRLKYICRAKSGEVHFVNSPEAEFQAGSQSFDVKGEAGIFTLGGVTVRWRKYAQTGTATPAVRLKREFFDADKIGTIVEVRHWRRGDRFWPIGMHHAVKLQDLFTNKKIPRQQRHRLLIGVAETQEIFWVEGLRISESFKLTKGTRRRLQWEWTR